MKINKKAQEEIVGFVVIVVIVSVALLILLWFLLSKPSTATVESFEVQSFIQTTLQYTTDCESFTDSLSVQDLIIACNGEEKCLDERDSCIVLNDTLTNIIESSWNVSEQSAVKGYKLGISIDDQEKLLLQKGNQTTNYKGDFQDFAREGSDYKVSLNIYYA